MKFLIKNWNGIALGIGLILASAALRLALNPKPSEAKPIEQSRDVRGGRFQETSTLTFAGISGLPPRFIDSGPLRGTGWIEYELRSILRGLRMDGIDFNWEYWTPARIAHEFRAGTPVCTYPYEWSDPKATFAKKADRLLSIPLDFTEESNQTIIFNQVDSPRFRKHVDSKGDLNVKSLLLDPNLKLALIRDRDYGPMFSGELTEVDAQGNQVVKKGYRTHVYLQMVHDNSQLIQMLDAHRFDYILSDAIEDQDLAQAGLDKSKFATLTFKTSKVKNLDDPSLVRLSVACSVHPLTLKVLPVLNQWIAVNRGGQQKRENLFYRRKVDAKYSKVPVQATYAYLAGRFGSQLRNGTADSWYKLQQAQFPGLQLFPAPQIPTEAQAVTARNGDANVRLTQSRHTPWHVVLDAQTLVILNSSQFYHRSILDSTADEYDTFAYNPIYPWDHRNLDFYLPATIQKKLFSYDFFKEPPGISSIQEFPLLLSKLQDQRRIRKLILFASGLQPRDMASLKELFAKDLEALTVFDAAPGFSDELLKQIPKGLTSLNMVNCGLSQTGFSDHVSGMSKLKGLALNSTQLRSGDFKGLLERIPEDIENLSLGFLSRSWTLENADVFRRRNWTHLKSLDLSCSSLDDTHLRSEPKSPLSRTLFDSVSASLERLDVGGNFFSPAGLQGIRKFDRLNVLKVSPLDVGSPLHPFQLPASLKEFESHARPLDGKFLFPPQHLQSLLAVWGNGFFSAPGLNTFLSRLGSEVKELKLSMAGVDLEAIRVLVTQTQVQHIERLDLSYNNLTDEAIELLSQGKFRVQHLHLDNNLIHDRGAQIIAKRWLPHLKSLNLSSNPITAVGSRSLAQALPPTLQRMELASLFELDTTFLASRLPRDLRVLDVSGNMISDREIVVLAPRLPRSLYHLGLAGSAFRMKGAQVLAQNFPPFLSVLDLSRVAFGSRGLEVLAPSLPQTLTDLFLSNLSLDPAAVEGLARSLPPNLRVLRLEGIDWRQESAARVLGALPDTVQSLTLSGVSVGLKGAQALSRHWPPFLRTLTLEGALLGDRGVEILSEGLPDTLEKIDLPDNQLTDQGLEALAKQSLDQVVLLNLSNNRFTTKGIQALGARKRGLKALLLTSCGLDSTALGAFGPNVLASLRRLHIGNNAFSNKSLIALIKKLSPEFYKLYIPSVGLTFEGVEDLIRVLPPRLTRLAIAGNDLGEKGFRHLDELVIQRAKEGPRLELFR